MVTIAGAGIGRSCIYQQIHGKGDGKFGIRRQKDRGRREKEEGEKERERARERERERKR